MYPINEFKTFGPPTRRTRFWGLWRGPLERPANVLPEVPPGHVLVLGLPDEYLEIRHQLESQDEQYLKAFSATVVDERTYSTEVELPLSGRSGADNFTMNAYFTCTVEEPSVVAQRGGRDVRTLLRNYLSANDEIGTISNKYSSSQLNDLRSELSLELRAYVQLRPPELPGFEVAFTGMDVATPKALMEADTKMQEQKWEHRYAMTQSKFERDEAREIENFINGDPEVMARRLSLLGIQNKSIGMRDVIDLQNQLAREMYESARSQQELRVQFATALVDRGFFDRTPDAMALVEQLWKTGLPIGTESQEKDKEGVQAPQKVGDADKPSLEARSVDTGLSDSEYDEG